MRKGQSFESRIDKLLLTIERQRWRSPGERVLFCLPLIDDEPQVPYRKNHRGYSAVFLVPEELPTGGEANTDI